MQRHVRRVRRVYQSRRDVLVAAVERDLAGALSVAAPPGGIAIWARVHDGIDPEVWARHARADGVVFQTAREFAFDGKPRPFVRLGFAAMTEQELQEAIRRMARSLPRGSDRTS